MATYHLRAKTISRARGQNAVAAAAYRSGERLTDEASGTTKHYRDRAGRVVFAGIFAPRDAPAWARDRGMLWNAVERIERRHDATLAREIELSLPHELSDRDRLWLVQDFARDQFMRRGFVVDVAIHAPEPERGGDARNHHAHLLVVERRLGPDGFAPVKDRDLARKATLWGWRAEWSKLVNRHLARCGQVARVDHRRLAAQGVRREPVPPMSAAAVQMERRGIVTPGGQRVRRVRARNTLRQGWRAVGEEIGHARERQQERSRQDRKQHRGPSQQPPQTGPVSSAARTTRERADAYVRLCQHPVGDLKAWLAETGSATAPDLNRKAPDDAPQPGRSGDRSLGVREDALPALRGRLDADRGRGMDGDGLSAGPEQRAPHHDRLRPVRTDAVGHAKVGLDPERAAPRDPRKRAGKAVGGLGFRAAASLLLSPSRSSRGVPVPPDGPAAVPLALARLAAVVPERSAPEAAREVCSRGPPLPSSCREVSPETGLAIRPDSDGGEVEPLSYEAEVAWIVRFYARQIDGIRQTVMPREMMEATIRAIRDAQRAAIVAMREQRRWKRQKPVAKLMPS